MTLPSVHAMLPAMAMLAIPAFLVCVGITLLAYRKRHSRGGE
ncbi:MAG TPA: hypothetical protein VFS40_09940 [Gemmatimonadales bacterium]|nr:hypothetical protein [Gemmatimonadales bacterium]